MYRISVKRESRGLASQYLHDTLVPGQHIRARRPSGEFVIPCSQCPLVLVSAGVGITPMLSMVKAAIQENTNRAVWFVHGTQNSSTLAHASEIQALSAFAPNVATHVFFSQPLESDKQGVVFDHPGRVSAEWLVSRHPDPTAHFLLCGPAAFLNDLQTSLTEHGIAPDHIHFETFGPKG